MNDAMKSAIDGFATGRLLNEAKPFRFNSAGPQPGQFDPTPRYPDGTPVAKGFSTGTNRGRPGGAIGVGIQATTKTAIIERYQAGEGLQALAAAYSTSTQRVREIVTQAGVEIRPVGGQLKTDNSAKRSKDMAKVVEIQPEQIRKIHERYMAGERLADCVAGQGLSAGTAVSRFKEMGLEYPRPKVAVTGLPPRFTRNAPVSNIAAAVPPAPDEQMDEPETYAAAADSPVIAAQEMVTFPRLVTAFDDLPLQPGSTRRAYAPPAIIREGSLKPVVTPEVQTMRVNTLEQLPRLADFLRDLRGVEGIRIAGSVSIALSIEAEL